MKICEKIVCGDMSCVWACAKKTHPKILYILQVPFRVGGVRDYIYKQKQKPNPNQSVRS